MPLKSTAQAGKSPEQVEDTNLEGHKNVKETTDNDADDHMETPSDVENNKESPTEPEEGQIVKPGVLTVHVIEASNLQNKDMIEKSKTWDVGKSDPYVEVLFEDIKAQSQTVNNSLSPKWNFSSNFDVSGVNAGAILFTIFDADYGKDQPLGSCSISITDVFSELDSARWISLEGADSGQISVKFEYAEKQQENDEFADKIQETPTTEEKVIDTKESKSPSEMVSEEKEIPITDQKEDTKDESPSFDTSEKTELIWADEVEREKNQAYEMNIERAEKVVEEIVLKAEKVMDQVQEKLNKSDTTKASTESLTEFSKITEESKEVVQKLEESYIKVKEEEKTTISVSGESFQRIEQESKEIVCKLNESYHKEEEHISTVESRDKVTSEKENEATDSKE